MSPREQFATDTDILTDIPKLYAVIIFNDDYTPMDFVVDVLMKIFRKGEEEANEIMLAVHKDGQGVAGVYPYDIALTKKYQAERMSAEQSHPLKFGLSEEKKYEA